MSKIDVSKVKNQPRKYIIYHYRPGKSNKVRKEHTQAKPVSKKKPTIKQTRTNNKVNVKQKILKNVTKSRSEIKVSRKGTNRTKSNFDLDVSKIKSIRDIGKDKILVVFAPGPSILEAKIDRLIGIKNIDSMTINKPDKRFWPTDYWMFCDRTQYNRNMDEFRKFSKTIINTESIKAYNKNQIKMKTLHGKGFSLDMIKGFYIGRSTTFSSMQVANWMGYDKIFIFGCDMAKVGDKLHSYGVNPDVPSKIRERRFKIEAEFYDAASKIMNEDLRKKFYFCSSYNPWPFVDRFNKLDQKEAVGFILNEHRRICEKSK